MFVHAVIGLSREFHKFMSMNCIRDAHGSNIQSISGRQTFRQIFSFPSGDNHDNDEHL